MLYILQELACNCLYKLSCCNEFPAAANAVQLYCRSILEKSIQFHFYAACKYCALIFHELIIKPNFLFLIYYLLLSLYTLLGMTSLYDKLVTWIVFWVCIYGTTTKWYLQFKHCCLFALRYLFPSNYTSWFVGYWGLDENSRIWAKFFWCFTWKGLVRSYFSRIF